MSYYRDKLHEFPAHGTQDGICVGISRPEFDEKPDRVSIYSADDPFCGGNFTPEQAREIIAAINEALELLELSE